MKVVVFDLDDTLYKEIEYLKSAYREIAFFLQKEFDIPNPFHFMMRTYEEGKNVFQELNTHYNLSFPLERYLLMYRNHFPEILLDGVVSTTLTYLQDQGCNIGLITDGRKITQRNKIKSLGLMEYLDENLIVISEEFGTLKPNINNYLYFHKVFPDAEYFYIGDNPQKDFISPNILGWKTICLLDNGLNIHKQEFNLPKEYTPNFYITSLYEIVNII